MGGIGGGLYAVFCATRFCFISVLIGPAAAKKVRDVSKCGTGGAIILGAIGVVLGLVADSSIGGAAAGGFLGIFFGLVAGVGLGETVHDLESR